LRIDETRAMWRRTAFAWGETDCILAVCDHVRRCTGVDPAAPWRGTYHDEAGAMAIYEAHGGVLSLMRHGMALAGFAAGDAFPGRPVVCLVGGHEVAGVCFGRRVGFLAEDRGLIEMSAEIVEAWVI